MSHIHYSIRAVLLTTTLLMESCGPTSNLVSIFRLGAAEGPRWTRSLLVLPWEGICNGESSLCRICVAFKETPCIRGFYWDSFHKMKIIEFISINWRECFNDICAGWGTVQHHLAGLHGLPGRPPRQRGLQVLQDHSREYEQSRQVGAESRLDFYFDNFCFRWSFDIACAHLFYLMTSDSYSR